MSDLIKRKSALYYVDRLKNSGTGKAKSLEYLRTYLEKLPSADAVSVVRCDECENFHQFAEPDEDLGDGFCDALDRYCPIWGFCFIGERRSE